MLTKNERIELRKKVIGSKRNRKREKHSDKFNGMFSFFLQIVRKGICDFCGSDVTREYKTQFDIGGVSAKMAFKMYEQSEFEDDIIRTRHPNLIISLIQGKRGWGLWKQQWALGIADGTFTKNEILSMFEKNNILIPEAFINEFENIIWEERYALKNNYPDLYYIDNNFKIKLHNDKNQNR